MDPHLTLAHVRQAVVVGGGYKGIVEMTEGLEDMVNLVKVGLHLSGLLGCLSSSSLARRYHRTLRYVVLRSPLLLHSPLYLFLLLCHHS